MPPKNKVRKKSAMRKRAYLIRSGDTWDDIASYVGTPRSALSIINRALAGPGKLSAGKFLLLPQGPAHPALSLHGRLARQNRALFGGRSDDPPWLLTAWREEGQRSKEPGRNNRIIEYLASVSTLDPVSAASDETAWCACFAQWCLAQVGIAGRNSAWALSWGRWGQQSDLRRGALAVFRRKSAKSGKEKGGHVGFVLEEGRDALLLLGGNQGKAVSQQQYPKDGVKGSFHYELLSCRWPP